jgi:hypothetical protein
MAVGWNCTNSDRVEAADTAGGEQGGRRGDLDQASGLFGDDAPHTAVQVVQYAAQAHAGPDLNVP